MYIYTIVRFGFDAIFAATRTKGIRGRKHRAFQDCRVVYARLQHFFREDPLDKRLTVAPFDLWSV